MDFEVAQLINEFRPGLYRHYKGGLYVALFVSENSTNDTAGSVDVVYFSCTAHGRPTRSIPIKHREITEFFSWVPKTPIDVPRNKGQKEPRFAYIGYAPAAQIRPDLMDDGMPQTQFTVDDRPVGEPVLDLLDGGSPGLQDAAIEEVQDIPGISAPTYGVLNTDDGTITQLEVGE